MREIISYLAELLRLPVHTNLRLTPPTVSLLDPVSTVVDMMIEEDIGAVVAMEENRPVGIITEKDVLERIIKPQKDFEKTLVKDVMSKPLIAIEAERPIKEALELMRKHNIKRLVVTKDDALIGLTTERRLLEVAHARYMVKDYYMVKSPIFDELRKIRVAYVSTYPPRECGIATYTKDLVDAISNLYVLKPPVILAINDKGGYYNYAHLVKFQIDREQVESYIEAAEYINDSDTDIVNIQHEFGLFGGVWGEYIVTFLERLEKPVITTLHTVLLDPPPDARMVLKRILQHSDYVIVMARVGIQILEQLYETFADKVRYIPHGCPNVPFIRSETIKSRLGLKDRVVLSTFGLLSRGKGIEYAIKALPKIVEEEPGILYLIIGETHPEVRKHEGETYRKRLFDIVESLGLEKNVRFINHFLPKNELIRYLQATDTYIIPYPNEEQISSGTLLYALSTGKAIVSTPFLHAKEVIHEGCAMECEFKNPSSIADCITMLLQYDDIKRRLEERAYEYSRGMIWPNVAMKYVNLLYKALRM
jgi:glycosyltransferase involved in cell wall biosynthesis/predicted transcriptional regulator